MHAIVASGLLQVPAAVCHLYDSDLQSVERHWAGALHSGDSAAFTAAGVGSALPAAAAATSEGVGCEWSPQMVSGNAPPGMHLPLQQQRPWL